MKNILYVSFKHALIVFLGVFIVFVLLNFIFSGAAFASVGQETGELISLLGGLVSYFSILKWSAGQLHKQGYAQEARRIAIQSSIIAICISLGIRLLVMQAVLSQILLQSAIFGVVFFYLTERYVSGKSSMAKSFQLIK